MLGVVSERFTRGGALALNVTSAVGQLGVGIIGAVFLGFIQDGQINDQLLSYDSEHGTDYHHELVTETKSSIFGEYRAINYETLEYKSSEAQLLMDDVENKAKKRSEERRVGKECRDEM